MSQFNLLIQDHFGQLSLDELATLRSYFKEEHLSRSDFFTKAGDICNRLSIINSGILRVYALADGKEITQWIAAPDSLMTEVMGFFYDQPNRWNIQALTDVRLLTLSKDSYRELCRTFPKWGEIEKRFIVKCFAMLEDRVFSHLSMSAEERYQLYFQEHKELYNQVPLQYIASVLGMSPETFSRIRKRQQESS